MDSLMIGRGRMQRLEVQAAVEAFAENSEGRVRDNARRILRNRFHFERFYIRVIEEYIHRTQAEWSTRDETGTPILDWFSEFIKYLWESGLLEYLIGIFFGLSMVRIPEGYDFSVAGTMTASVDTTGWQTTGWNHADAAEKTWENFLAATAGEAA